MPDTGSYLVSGMLRYALYLCCALLWCSPPIAAQELRLPVRRIGVDDGLPQNSVYSLLQDSKGFLWIGTGDGLARWDGRVFRTFRGRFGDTSGHSLAPRIFHGAMVEDRSHRIWFCTNHGLGSYDLAVQKFHATDLPGTVRTDLLQVIGIGSDGMLYCHDNLHVWNIDTRGGSAKVISLRLALGESIVSGVMVGPALYIMTTGGLYGIGSNGSSITILRDTTARYLFRAAGGTVHLWLRRGLVVVRGMQASTVVAFPSYFTDPYAYPLLPLGDSAYYAAGGGGLAYVPLNGRPASIMPAGPRRNMLSSSLLTLAMPDRSGNLWLGTEGGGLNMLDTRGFRFEGYTPSREQEEAPDLMVKSLCDVDGRLWIGTFNQGLYVLGQDRQLAKHIAPSVSGNERISVLQHDSKGRLWMNREAQIGYVDKGSAQFIRSTLIPDGHAVNVAAMSLYELGPDRFLLGSIDHLHYMTLGADGNITIRPIAQRSAVTTGQIAALERGPDGSIFMGKVRDGFYHLRIFPEQDSVAILDHGFHQTGIRDFQTVGGGKYLWMATENGLLFYNTATRRYRMIDEADGLSNSHIYGILPQDDSAVWVSTNRGLNQVHYRLTGGSLQLRCVHAFTAADGLQSNEFNTGAFCKLNDGSFAFGGVVGVNWFNPVKQPSNPHLPQVAITGIRVLSHPLQSDTDAAFLHSLTLPYDSNTVAFSFAALEFTAPAGNRCQYRLQGFDNDWVDGGEDREARYANLPPGHYRFLVRAANADGVWNPAPAKLSLVIVPPWWRTPLAYFIFALLVSATLTLVIRTIIRQRVRRRLRILEREQAVNEERLRISRDMHDELGTGLTKIALLSEVAQRKAVASAQLQPLSEIARTSRQLTEKIGEIVWTLNPQNDTLDTLAAYIREWVQEQYDALGDVHVRTDIPEDLPPLSLGHRTRQALLLVTKEAVNNAVKHSLAAQITVRIRLSASTISFTVSDNGIGFRPGGSSGAGRGNGLGNMAARMQGAGGRFSIGSTPGSGTTIEFSVPRPTE